MSYVRALRIFLIAIIAIVSLSVAINYTQIWRKRIQVVRRAAQILSSEVVRAGESIEYSDYQNGFLRFKIRAEKLLETREGKSLLEGIEGIDMNPDGTVGGRIRSRRAEYDKKENRAFFTEDVQMDLGQGLQVRTQSLNYDLTRNVGSTDDPFQFQSSQLRGRARGFRYDHVKRDFTLNGEVDFIITRAAIGPDGSAVTEDYHVTSERGYLSRLSRLCRFEGHARLESAMGVLSGDRVEAGFSDDLKELRSMFCEGNAVLESRESSDRRRIGGDRMIFGIAGDGRGLEKIDIHGHASFLAHAAGADQNLQAARLFINLDPVRNLLTGIYSEEHVVFRTDRNGEETLISAEKLDAGFFAGTSELEKLHAWDNARMSILRPGEQGKNDLEAQAIHLSFQALRDRSAVSELVADKDVRWISISGLNGKAVGQSETRTLQAEFLRIRFSGADSSPESGNATGQVTVSGIPAGERQGIRRMQADAVQFTFYGGVNRLKGVHGDGNVRVFFSRPPGNDGSASQEFRTSSNYVNASFRQEDGSAERVSQWGNFVFQDASRTVTSGRGDYEAASEKLVLTESPHIVDVNGTTTGERMEYSRSSGLFSVHHRARSVFKTGPGGGGASPFGASSDSGSTSVVTAGQMQYWPAESKVRYSGDVQLLAETSQLQSDSLEILKGGATVHAQGKVKHVILRRGSAGEPSTASSRKAAGGDKPVAIASQALDYVQGKKSIRYSGGVSLRSGDMEMTSDTLVAVFDAEGKQIESGTASGNLQIRQAGRTIRGDTADYDLKAGRVVVTGSPAIIQDPARGKSAAVRLTFFTADDRILLENK